MVGEGWKPILTPPVPDLFSGAATYSYPIQTPAGRNGLQPNVVLSYNGRRIDMLKEMENEEGGPVALGWSLNIYSLDFGTSVTGIDPGSATAVGVDVSGQVVLHERTSCADSLSGARPK